MVPYRGRRRGFGLRGRRRRVVYEQRREESSPPAYRSLDKQVPRSARDDRRKKAAGRLRRRALPRPACHSEPLHALAARNLKPCRVQRSRFFASLRMTRSVCRLAGVADGGGAFFEQVAVPDGALAGVVGELEILRELEGVGGAGVFAAAAEHAARQIVGKVGEHLAAALVVAGPADDDQVLRAGECAEVAGDAEGFAGLGIVVEAGGAAVALGHHGALLGVLLGVAGARALVAEGPPQARQEVNQEQPLERFLRVHRPARTSPLTLSAGAFAVKAGGGGGIRTHEAREGLPAFEAGPFNPSGTPPHRDQSEPDSILALSSRAQRGICCSPNKQVPRRQGTQGLGMTD